MSKKTKGGSDFVYSTNPNFQPSLNEDEQEELAPEKQQMKVLLDRKNRGGKTATLITGYIGSEASIKELGKELKNKCGCGGTVKEGEILIQGDVRDKVIFLLEGMGYKAKKSGG